MCCEKRCEMSGETGGILRKLGERQKSISLNVYASLIMFSELYVRRPLQFSRPRTHRIHAPLHMKTPFLALRLPTRQGEEPKKKVSSAQWAA